MPGHEEQPDEGSRQAFHARSPARSAAVFAAQHGDGIEFEHLYDDDNQQLQQQLGGRVLHLVGEVQQQQTGIGYGRTGNYGQETACQSRYGQRIFHQEYEKDV